MEDTTQATTRAVAQQQPVHYVRALQSVPTTQLLHFSVIIHIIVGALCTLVYGCVALSFFAIRDGTGAAGACLFLALVLGGGSLWWWIHCLKTLRNLRKYAEELFYNSLQARS
jgi:hypothetical protein